MSDNIPFDIQLQIIKLLPARSLIQFRSVSKEWKYLIDSSDFIARYSGQVQHLLVRYRDAINNKQNHVSIVDDDTFPQQRVSLTPPQLVSMLKDPSNMPDHSTIIGSSHGLLCFYGYYKDGRGFSLFGTRMVVLWNISIRKAVAVVLPNAIVPNAGDRMYRTALGFGVCRETTDPKIVKVRYFSNPGDMESVSCIPGQVEVFTLSTRAWRRSYGNLPRKSIQLLGFQVDIDGLLYGLAADRVTMDGGYSSYNLIISFDVTSEEFREVDLPNTLAHHRCQQNLFVSKLRNSVVVLEHHEMVYIVWMMNDGEPKSFAKLFTISTPDAAIRSVLEFRKSGEPVIEVLEHWCDPLRNPSSLVVYEPESEHSGNLRIDGMYSFSFSGSSYMETLLLLDQPNCIIYDEGNTTL